MNRDFIFTRDAKFTSKIISAGKFEKTFLVNIRLFMPSKFLIVGEISRYNFFKIIFSVYSDDFNT